MAKKINIEQRMAERELAFRSVFQIPFYENETEAATGIEYFVTETITDPSDDLPEMISGDFSKAVTQAVLDQRETIDGEIAKYIKKGWSMERIPRVELAVLRLAVAELYYFGTPKEIVINEAVNLVKHYGDEDGYRFVNGILNQLAKDHLEKEAIENQPEPEAEMAPALEVDAVSAGEDA